MELPNELGYIKLCWRNWELDRSTRKPTSNPFLLDDFIKQIWSCCCNLTAENETVSDVVRMRLVTLNNSKRFCNKLIVKLMFDVSNYDSRFYL